MRTPCNLIKTGCAVSLRQEIIEVALIKTWRSVSASRTVKKTSHRKEIRCCFMKKISFAAAVLLSMTSAIPFSTCCFASIPNVTAASDESTDIYYNDMHFTLREDRTNELILNKYFGTEPNLIVPETVEGFTVTGLGDNAFAANKAMGYVVENVALPDSIDYFGDSVFQDSTVVSVNIPKKLRFIPSLTFSRCKNLKTVAFHDDIVSIANSAFQKTSVTIPQNLQKRISDDSKTMSPTSKSQYHSTNDDFKIFVATDKDTDTLYCNIEGYTGNSSEIVFPESIFDIPVKGISLANLDTSSTKSLTFPKTTHNISIEANSFSNSVISELIINSPCTLKENAFENCTELKTVRFNEDAAINRDAFSGCTNLTSVEFCGKAELAQYAFTDCSSIENITLDTSQAINGYAFDGCISLMNINSEPVFDSSTGGFTSEYSDFIRGSFYMAEEIGFLNEYVKARYKQIADEVTAPYVSDTEKVKALHDWVCKNTQYASGDTNPAEYHTDASILLNDSTVCEGYAKAFNLLCHSVGIESYYIHSSNHAWNIVKIGGHYFHVDTTWDDVDGVKYSWFMRSDSELNADNSHGEWKEYIPSSLHSFQKGGTPECGYQIGDVNQDGKISAADLVRMNRYMLNAESETADNIVLYDMNLDGNSDVFDMILMRKKIIDQ